MKKIYVCSRLRAETKQQYQKHIDEALMFSKFVVRSGFGAPFAPHVFYSLFLDDTVSADRQAGMDAGFAYLAVCDGLFAFVNEDEFVSGGMKVEIQYAYDHNIPVYVFKLEDDVIQPYNTLVDVWSASWLKAL